MFASGFKDQAGTFEQDARCIKIFEAESTEEAKLYYKEFLYGSDGFFEKLEND